MLWVGHLKSSLLMQPDWYCSRLNCHTILVLKPPQILSESHSVMFDSFQPHGQYILWNSPGQNTGVGILSLLEGIFPTRDWTQVSWITGGFFTNWATREALRYWSQMKMSCNRIQNSQTVFPKTQCLTKKYLQCHTHKKVCCHSVAQSYWTLCDPIDCSTPGLPALHYLPEFAQTHVHPFDNVIQLSHPLSSPSPALSLSQHRGLFQWVSSSHQVGQGTGPSFSALVISMSIQGWFPLGFTGFISSCPRDSQESSLAPQLESIDSSVLSLLNDPILTSIGDYWKNHNFDYMKKIGKISVLLL